jgi:hypothetical protein
MSQLQSFARKQQQNHQQFIKQEPQQSQQFQQHSLQTNISTVLSITSSPTMPPPSSEQPTKKRSIRIDNDDDDNDNDNSTVFDDDVKVISNASKRNRCEVNLTTDEQSELDDIEKQRKMLFAKARKRTQQREEEDTKLQELLSNPTDEQRAILLSLLYK